MSKIKIGVFGVGRGSSFIRSVLMLNDTAELVALCDMREEAMDEAVKDMETAPAKYTAFDEFIEHPGLEAVVLANCFHEHASYAIRCLERGIHVLSECTAAATMADSVALVRAARNSKAVYMLAENYPYMQFNQEMRSVYRGGTLGKVLFAEGEYNHPFDQNNGSSVKGLRPYPKHWRNYLPRSYYITHSLAPLMFITGSTPKRITAFPVYAPFETEGYKYISGKVADRAAVISILNDDDSVFRVTGCAAYGAHGNSYRICGTKGQIENVRGGAGKVMLRYNEWEVPEGKEAVNYYTPVWPDDIKELVEKTAHGGSDFFPTYEFLNCIKEGRQPEFDVYFATTLASVAILAHRSILNGNIPYDIPDFRDEEQLKKYENDTDTPFWSSDGTKAPTIPCCSNPDYEIPAEIYKNYLDLFEE